MTEPVSMLLADAARLLGTTPDALRKKVKRGQVQAVRDNAGRLLVWVDPPAEPGQVSSRPAIVQAGQVDGLASRESTLVQSLRDHIETLKGLLIAEVERTQAARDEAQEARAEADHAKADQVRMARDVTTMFDEMKALADKHAELHSDRARLQAESEQRTRELDRLRNDQAAERAQLLDQLAQARSEAANERAHSRSLSEQFERVHREHRDDADRERRPWWRRLLGR